MARTKGKLSFWAESEKVGTHSQSSLGVVSETKVVLIDFEALVESRIRCAATSAGVVRASART